MEKEWGKTEENPSVQLTKVRNKKEAMKQRSKGVIDGSLSSEEFGANLSNKNTKGRVVLRGVLVKDDSVSYAVFTEQGYLASQMTTAKVMDIKSRLPGFAGQAADAVSADTQVKMEDTLFFFKKTNKSKVTMSRYLDTSTKAQMAKIMIHHGRPSRSSRKESVRSPCGRTFVGKAI